MQEVVAKYPDTEGSLYTVSGMVCQNLINDIEKFAKHKKKYTLQFANNILELIEEAKAMPNQDQRQGVQNTLRNAVVRANGGCCDSHMALMTYINTDGFEAEDIDAMKKMAGSEYYRSASEGNWQSVRTMNSMAIDFVNKYPAELAKCDMPDDFPERLSASANVFAGALKNFNDNKTVSEGKTAAKVRANNDVYDLVMGVLEDGKYIFRKDVVQKKVYSYRALLSKVIKKKSGYHISLTDGTSGKPIQNAHIAFLQSDKTADSDKKGVIEVELAEGTYSYVITSPEYEPMEGVIVVDKNVMHREDIQMQKGGAKSEIV